MAGRVELLAYTPDAEKLVASAAKLCYSSAGIKGLMDNLDKDHTNRFLYMLMDLGHESPVEHISFTFGIEGVSRSLLAQITRHRIASFSVKSQRYVREGSFEFVVPPRIEKNEAAKELYLKAMREDQGTYNRLTDILYEEIVQEMLKAGKDEKEAKRDAEKQAIEDARFVLPNACETKMILTMNARSLLNFFHHRCCARAQWEIRHIAEEMLDLVKEVCPIIFAKSGPPCVSGPCAEGKMSCGRMAEMREKYQK